MPVAPPRPSPSSPDSARAKPARLGAQALAQHYQQAVQWHQQGFLSQAEAAYETILASHPRHADALHLLGVLRGQGGQGLSGLALIDKALALDGTQAAFHSNRGNVLASLDRHAQAIASFDKALALQPKFAQAHANRGLSLLALQRTDEALQSIDRALSLQPELAEAWSHRSSVLRQLQRLPEALQSADRALALRPDHADALCNKGTVLAELDRGAEALACFEQAARLHPAEGLIQSNWANALRQSGQLQEACAHHRQALALRPHDATVHSNLGATCQAMGQLDLALAHYRQALVHQPDHPPAHSNLLMALSFDEATSPAAYLAQAKAWGAQAVARAQASSPPPLQRHAPRAGPPSDGLLKVGMVSADFQRHPVGFFLDTVVHGLRAQGIELHAFSANLHDDDLTERLRPAFAHWTPIRALSDRDAAQRVHDADLDVLIDLAGHTAGNRLGVFAWRPAPVQASWLGYFASTGLPGMDFLLTDRTSLPANPSEQFSETLWALPDTRLCLAPPCDPDDLPPGPLPALQCGHLTFGSFQSLTKLSDTTLRTWATVMQRLPTARLRLQNAQLGDASLHAGLLARLEREGIASPRVELWPGTSRTQYLQDLQRVDVILDTFPYPGGTTSFEALWMGVPTLTRQGSTLLSSQGASLMAAAGLSPWVVHTEAEFADRAVALTQDLPALAALRAGLRERVRTTALFDGELFARQLAQALRGMAATSTHHTLQAPSA